MNSESLELSWSLFGATWATNVAVAAPDGWQTAEKLTETATTGEHYTEYPLTYSASNYMTFSVYLRQSGRTTCVLYVWDWGNTSNRIHVTVDLSNGTLSNGGATGTGIYSGSTITNVGSDWYRVTLSGRPGSVGASIRPRITLTNPAGSYLGNTANGMLVWGAQVNDGIVPGSYVKTGATLGAQVLATPSSWTWTDNPSIILGNFLASKDYGCNKSVDWDTLIACAAANDEQIGGDKRRTLNVTFEGELAAKDVAETLRAYAACWMTPGDNGIRFIRDRPATSVASYSHASGQIYSIRVSKKDSGNIPTVVEVVYTNRDTVPWRDESVYVELPGVDVTVPRRSSKIAMPGIHKHAQAKREATERLNKLNLSDLSAVVEVFDIGVAHEAGDVVTITAPQVGLTNPKLMRVMNEPEMTGLGIWRLSCVEYDPAVYSNNVETVPTYPDTGLTNPLVAPSTPTGLGYEFEQSGIDIFWNRNPEMTVVEYELRQGSNWGDGTPLHSVTTPTILEGTAFTWPPQPIGTYTIWIKARTSVGVESVTPASITFTINAPTLSTLTAAVEGANYKLVWALGSADLPIKFYRIKRAGVVIAEVNATEFVAPVDWSGTGAVTFTVQAISICGCPGTESSVNLSIQMPSQVASFIGSAIVNNVLFYWTPGAITGNQLPIKHFVLKKGDVYGTAGVIGDKSGDATFTTYAESSGGQFKYWIEPHDTAGNIGTAVSTLVQVSAPANFKVVDEFDGSSFDGTKTNAVIWDGSLIVPVNPTETFQQHFQTNNGPWTSPQDQMNAGYDIYIEPAQATGSYQKVFALGASTSGTMISMILSGAWVDGTNGTITPTIEISNTSSTGPWTSVGNVWQAYASNFQWVRITLAFTSTNADDVYRADALTLTLALQVETDSGWVDADDATGIWSGAGTVPSPYKATVPFNKNFIDVDSITVTPMGTAAPGSAITPMVVFSDVADPDNFDVYFFNSSGGTVKTDFSWNATGVL